MRSSGSRLRTLHIVNNTGSGYRYQNWNTQIFDLSLQRYVDVESVEKPHTELDINFAQKPPSLRVFLPDNSEVPVHQTSNE